MNRKTVALIMLCAMLSIALLVVVVRDLRDSRNWDDLTQTVTRQSEALILQAKSIETLQNPQHFESCEEMRSWVRSWVLTKLPLVLGDSNSPWQLTLRASELHSDYWGCDDIAEAMQRDALKEGHMISAVLVDYEGKVYGVVVGPSNHAGNIASTESAYWFIEPQTGQITKIVDRR